MPRYFALVPAAGAGARMGEAIPKQYLLLAGEPLINHALRTLAGDPRIERVFVVLAPTDSRFDDAPPGAGGGKIEVLRCGGELRATTVRNGLMALRNRVFAEDWVLVHDAARPCLSAAALDRLIREVGDDAVGGLLAIPVADTLKRADSADRIAATEPRAGLWQAQTPQMFRHGMLLEALERAGPADLTDEAAAILDAQERP